MNQGMEAAPVPRDEGAVLCRQPARPPHPQSRDQREGSAAISFLSPSLIKLAELHILFRFY